MPFNVEQAVAASLVVELESDDRSLDAGLRRAGEKIDKFAGRRVEAVKLGADGKPLEDAVARSQRVLASLDKAFRPPVLTLNTSGFNTAAKGALDSLARLQGGAVSVQRQMLRDAADSGRALMRQAQDEARVLSKTDADAGRARLREAQDTTRGLLREAQDRGRLLVEIERQNERQVDAVRRASSGEGLVRRGTGLSSVGAGLRATGQGMTYGYSVPALALGGFALKKAVSYESDFSNVRKTTGGTDAQAKVLRGQLEDLSTQVPQDWKTITNVASTVGQLGVARDQVRDVTKQIIELNVATKLPLETGTLNMVKFANSIGEPTKNIGRLGSVISEMDKDSKATSSDVLSMSLRLAGAAHAVGMSGPQILAFANAFAGVGVRAQQGGSAVSTAIGQIDRAVTKGGQSVANFAAVAGMSSAQFSKEFKENAAGAVAAFIEGLGKLRAKHVDLIPVLDALGLKNNLQRDAFLRASGAGDALSHALARVDKAYADNTATTDRYNKATDNTQSQLIELRNQADLTAVRLGEAMLPAMKSFLPDAVKLTHTVAGWVSEFEKLPAPVKQGALEFAAITIAAGPLVSVLGGAIQGFGTITRGIGAFKLLKTASELGNIEGGALGLASAFPKVGAAAIAAEAAESTALAEGATGLAAAGPWGLAVLAAAGLVGGIALAWKNAKDAQDDYAKHKAGLAAATSTGDTRTNVTNQIGQSTAEAQRLRGLVARLQADPRAVIVPRDSANGRFTDTLSHPNIGGKGGYTVAGLEAERQKQIKAYTASATAIEAGLPALKADLGTITDLSNARRNLTRQIGNAAASEKASRAEIATLKASVEGYGRAGYKGNLATRTIGPASRRLEKLESDLAAMEAGRRANVTALGKLGRGASAGSAPSVKGTPLWETPQAAMRAQQEVLAQFGTMKDRCGDFVTALVRASGASKTFMASAGAMNTSLRVHPDAQGNYPAGTIFHLGAGGKGTTRHYASTYDGTHVLEDLTAPQTKGGPRVGRVDWNRTVDQIKGRILQAYLPTAALAKAWNTTHAAPAGIGAGSPDPSLVMAPGLLTAATTRAYEATHTERQNERRRITEAYTQEVADAKGNARMIALAEQEKAGALRKLHAEIETDWQEHLKRLNAPVMAVRKLLAESNGAIRDMRGGAKKSGLEAFTALHPGVPAALLQTAYNATQTQRGLASKQVADQKAQTIVVQAHASALESVQKRLHDAQVEQKMLGATTDKDRIAIRDYGAAYKDLSADVRHYLDLAAALEAQNKKTKDSQDAFAKSIATQASLQKQLNAALIGAQSANDVAHGKISAPLSAAAQIRQRYAGLGSGAETQVQKLIGLGADTTRTRASTEQSKKDAAALTSTQKQLTEALAGSQIAFQRASGHVDRYDALLARLNIDTKTLTIAQQSAVQAMLPQIAAYDEATSKMRRYQDMMHTVSDQLAYSLSGAFENIMSGSKVTFSSVATDFEHMVIRMIAEAQAAKLASYITGNNGLGGLLSGIFGGKPKDPGGDPARGNAPTAGGNAPAGKGGGLSTVLGAAAASGNPQAAGVASILGGILGGGGQTGAGASPAGVPAGATPVYIVGMAAGAQGTAPGGGAGMAGALAQLGAGGSDPGMGGGMGGMGGGMANGAGGLQSLLGGSGAGSMGGAGSIGGAASVAAPYLAAIEAFRLLNAKGFGAGLIGKYVFPNLGKWFKKHLHFAEGGIVPGQGNTDSVPAMLMPREVVLSRAMLAGTAPPPSLPPSFITNVQHAAPSALSKADLTDAFRAALAGSDSSKGVSIGNVTQTNHYSTPSGNGSEDLATTLRQRLG